MDNGDNQKWMELLRDYMIDNHINHTFWCLNPNSGDTGGLLGYDFSTWDMDKYNLFEPSLWQTSTTGKYIGLDHQKALGANGISVSDYYKTYASSEGSNLDSDGSTQPKEPATVPTDNDDPTEKPTQKPTERPNVDFIPGDIVVDKKVNVFDSIALKNALLNDDFIDALYASPMDTNGDGTITTADLVLLNEFLKGKDVTFKVYSE